MRRIAPPWFAFAVAIGLAVAGCGGGAAHTIPPGDNMVGHHDLGDSTLVDLGTAPQGSTDLATQPFWAGVVYAHSSTTLYSVDPDTLKITRIADFGWPSGSDSMTDIAVDKDGNMIGISFSAIYSVDPKSGKCKFLASFSGGSFNGLSFVPAPRVDPTSDEILIGANIDGSVWKIDPMTGQQSKLGDYGQGMGSSGDIVAVEGATYATVTWTTGNDWLVQVDPASGKATPVGRVDTGYSHIWGVGYWKGQVFGFTDGGQMILIDVKTGIGKAASTSSFSWWGAAVTTIAPTIQ